jgi:hypothetical protein
MLHFLCLSVKLQKRHEKREREREREREKEPGKATQMRKITERKIHKKE